MSAHVRPYKRSIPDQEYVNLLILGEVSTLSLPSNASQLLAVRNILPSGFPHVLPAEPINIGKNQNPGLLINRPLQLPT
jgi:hypothetical protein